MSDHLLRFIRHARDRQLSLADVGSILRAAGWKDRQIAQALCASALELPVPEPPGAGSARDAFFHLLAFTALYTWVTSLVLLLFGFVDLALPDPAWHDSDSWREARESGMRTSMATLIVAYPTFALIWRRLLRLERRDPQQARLPLRRWLLHLSLFVGAVTIASDLITLLDHLLEGQLSARFVIKVIVLLIIAGSGTGYLWWILRHPPEVER